MAGPVLPAFDNHAHLDPAGRVEEAVKEFHRAGGTAVLVVHKPYGPNRSVDDHRAAMDTTLRLVERARAAVPCVRVLVALGPHPAELTQLLAAGVGLDEARLVMEGALAVAGRHVAAGRAVALGEIGRPHWSPVDPAVWDASNALMEHGFALARDLGCPVQLHTETATPDVFADLASRARRAGLAPERVVKHYSPPIVDEAANHGLWPSVLVGKDAAETALRQGTRFMMETDHMDDPRHPGAVLGPKTVPKRTHALVAAGTMREADAWTIHVENPKRVYGVDVAP